MAWIVKSSPCPEWDTCKHGDNCIYGHVNAVFRHVLRSRSAVGTTTVFVANMELDVDFQRVVIPKLNRLVCFKLGLL